MSMSGWVGVDLDGTLTEYHGWNGGAQGDIPDPFGFSPDDCAAIRNATDNDYDDMGADHADTLDGEGDA